MIDHLHRQHSSVGTVVVGGDNYRIGLGGGSVSSVDTGRYSNGIELKDYSSKQLTDADFSDTTLVITMEETQRQKILSEYENATEENTRLLNELVGDELEVMDPYGGSVQTYGLCYEVLKASIEKLMRVLEA